MIKADYLDASFAAPGRGGQGQLPDRDLSRGAACLRHRDGFAQTSTEGIDFGAAVEEIVAEALDDFSPLGQLGIVERIFKKCALEARD